jgi:UDP-3-O-[3-hydroxymyristoyl] glucosamine N-acyltransferase
MAYFKHPTAVVESNNIGEGTKIWHFVHVRAGAKVGKNCVVGKSAYIDEAVEIGNGVKIQNFVSVYKGVKIEDNVLIGPSVTFTNDLYPRAFTWGEDKITPTVVRKGASIGANSTIVCGVTIGEYAMIGAGAVVTKNIPDYGFVLGIPARLKGFVCQCGMKLRDKDKDKSKEKNGEKVILKCPHCGKEVEIDRETYKNANMPNRL